MGIVRPSTRDDRLVAKRGEVVACGTHADGFPDVQFCAATEMAVIAVCGVGANEEPGVRDGVGQASLHKRRQAVERMVEAIRPIKRRMPGIHAKALVAERCRSSE